MEQNCLLFDSKLPRCVNCYAESGEKIALGITVLLAFDVLMLSVAENLPQTSEFVPLLSRFYLS